MKPIAHIDPDEIGFVGEPEGTAGADRRRIPPSLLLLALGAAALALPTMIDVSRLTWSTDAGAHGPIVLLTGIWLLHRAWPSARPLAAPPPAWRAVLVFSCSCLLFMLARLTQIIELEGYLMYATMVATGYALIGGRALARLIFPIVYVGFVFPPPETVIYGLTMPMKIAISEAAVWLLRLFGLPIGGTGVSIQIGQYELLVAAACSGLNSIVSLSALTTFYIYVRHFTRLKYAATLLIFVVPVAILANFIRVLILILLTYYAGEAVAQGFAHDIAGITMFALALGLIFLFDTLLARIWPQDPEPLPASEARA